MSNYYAPRRTRRNIFLFFSSCSSCPSWCYRKKTIWKWYNCMNPINFDRIQLLQQVAAELLKRYCDHSTTIASASILNLDLSCMSWHRKMTIFPTRIFTSSSLMVMKLSDCRYSKDQERSGRWKKWPVTSWRPAGRQFSPWFYSLDAGLRKAIGPLHWTARTVTWRPRKREGIIS